MGACSDPQCDHGWITANHDYAVRQSGTDNTADPAYQAARESVFPCPACRPAAFARWADGAYLPEVNDTGLRHTG